MKEKVFIIGFQKTGTTSLEHALQNLGYRVYGGDKNLMKFSNPEDLKVYIKVILKTINPIKFIKSLVATVANRQQSKSLEQQVIETADLIAVAYK